MAFVEFFCSVTIFSFSKILPYDYGFCGMLQETPQNTYDYPIQVQRVKYNMVAKCLVQQIRTMF